MAGDVFADLARHVDRAFYRHLYPDIAATGLDPVAHWHGHGLAERRRPNVWFDTAYYLDEYPDIAQARIDPLLHYVRHGRGEGRRARPRQASALATLAEARPAAARPVGYDAPANAPILDATQLAARLIAAMAAHAGPLARGGIGLLVAASHDRYIDVTGGIQLVLADEQAACAASGTTHLHLAPAIARLCLADTVDPPGLLQVTLDGVFQGLVPAAAAVEAIAAVAAAMPERPRRFAVHSPLGHRTDALRALAEACGPDAVYWLHDHTSLCEGFTLLRNDLEACHAPPAGSMACRICVYGAGRAEHQARLRALFDAVPFHVLAPSRPTLDLWLARAGLPFASARVCEPATLAAPEHHAGAAATDAARRDDGPLRVAFLGYPLPHKGWPLFLDLATALALDPGAAPLKLYHFAARDALRPMDAVTSVAVRVGAGARLAAVEALARHAIEAVIVASPWPETFSFVAHEAVAGGARVLALEAGGNVAAMVRRHGAGRVFPTGDDLLDHLLSGRAGEEIRAARPPARPMLLPGQGSLGFLHALLGADAR
ncbi:MAG: hypothetical protein KGK10_13340 [Rhodospirillales bacterium]|nr:hypothetical protein [Rhodospirillales bacterium]